MFTTHMRSKFHEKIDALEIRLYKYLLQNMVKLFKSTNL